MDVAFAYVFMLQGSFDSHPGTYTVWISILPPLEGALWELHGARRADAAVSVLVVYVIVHKVTIS